MKQLDYCRISYRMMRKHRLQYLLMILVISISCGTFVLVQMLLSCLIYTEREMRLDKYGHFSGIIVNMQEDSIVPEVVHAQDGGLIRVSGSIQSTTYGKDVLVGELDENAIKILNVQIKEGRMPQNQHEIALMYQDYIRLDQLVSVGDPIQFTVQDADGNSSEQLYTLCGILFDFNDKWNESFENIPEALLPTALTLLEDNSYYVAAVYGETYFHSSNIRTPDEWFGGNYYSNYFLMQGDLHEKSNRELYTRIALIARIVLLFLLFLGCRTVTDAFYRYHFRSTQLLRCVGMNQIGLFRIFFSIALVICLFSIVMGTACGIAFSKLSIFVLQQYRITIEYHSSLFDYLISVVSVFIIIILTFTIQILICMKKPEVILNTVPKHTSKIKSEYHSFGVLYRRTIGRSRSHQMRYLTLMLAVVSCTVFSVFYVSDIFSEDHYKSILRESNLIDADYAYLPLGGGCLPEYLNLEVVRNYGLTPEQIERINHSDSAHVTLAVTGEYASSFLYYNEFSETKAISKLVNNYSIRHNLEKEYDLQSDVILENVGLNNNEDLLEFPIYGVSLETLEQNNNSMIDGKLNEYEFQNGTEAVLFQSFGSDEEFQIGEELTIRIYEYDNSHLADKGYQPRLTEKKVSISAIYQIDEQSSDVLGQFLARAQSRQSCLFISDQLLFSADRELRYSTVFVNRNNRSVDSFSTEQELLDIYKQCRHGTYAFRNYVNLIAQQKNASKSYKAPFLILVWLMTTVLLLSYVFSNYTICSMNAKTDYLLMAIGIRKNQHASIIFFYDFMRCCRAIIYGFLIFACVMLLISNRVSFHLLIINSLKSLLMLIMLSFLISAACSIMTLNMMNSKETVSMIRQE